MHEHGVTLGDPVDGARTDRGVPRRDREGKEAPSRLRNGQPDLRDLVSRRHPALDRIGRDRASKHDDVDSVLLRSGSGKTPLLNVIAGWEQPTSGEVIWDDGVDPASPTWSAVADGRLTETRS